MTTVFTAGHSTHGAETLLCLLRGAGTELALRQGGSARYDVEAQPRLDEAGS